MRVCFCSTLVFWLIQLGCHSFLNGAEADDGFKGRKWSTGRDGHYRLVVSSDGESLDPEETVSIAEAQEKKLKEKPTEDIFSDKVTQRIILKRGRKRGERVPEETVSIRNRRRNPSVSAATTGLPQTMSYSLYNHFRPLEQDVPQDHLLPFLDFGRKLSPSGSTPSGINSIESSSTPRGELPPVKEEDESVFHEDMDVTVMRKAVERNTVPRGPLPVKPQPHIAAFLRRNSTSNQEAHVNTNVDLILINTTTTNNNNKTDKKDVHYDLQPNESGIKIHAILSPDYGLRLNSTEKKAFNQIETKPKLVANETIRITGNSTPSVDKTEYQKLNTTRHNVTRLSERQQLVIPLKIVQNSTIHEDKSKKEEEKSKSKKEEEKSETTSPKPTARVLSTAVVTSVSVKESAPRFPRIKTNLTRPESLSYQRLLTKNQMSENVNVTQLENRTRLDNHTMFSSFQNARRKMYTTLRPKTTTYKPVTFRSAFRRNMTSFGTGVVHIVSTPPTYIEVPKIFTVPVQKTPGEVTQNSSSEELKSVDIVDKSAALSSLETTVASTVSSTTVVSTSARTVSTSTVKPSTTTSATTDKPSITSLTTSTTEEMEIPNSSSAGTTKRSPIPSEVPTEPTTQTISEPPPTGDTEATESNSPVETTTISLAEETSIEIDLKPLNVDVSTPAERPRPESVPTKKPGLLWVYGQRNHSVLKNTPVGVAYPESPLGLATYVLAGLGLVPLILGIFVLLRQLLLKSRKKVLDESEYSSEYNRTPLPTKLPRVPAHINWDGEKTSSAVQTTSIPVTKWEFSRDKLRLQTVLGQGNFGQVWKAEADDLSGHEGSTRLVAVKTVKEGASLREKEDLLRELGIMQELGAHPNVVTLLGCCTEKEPYLLIMEYVMYGKLLAFLREHRTRAHYFNFSDLSSALTSRDITVFAYCVARGMEYLVTKGIIHRDLAARNILVDHNKLCKIADFGMSRNVRDTGQIYEQRPNRGALPIRWMAPESLYLSLFTEKSDVWSYAILLWEIITLGSTPYNKMGAREVMRQVREGYRLEKPKHCRTELYKVLSKCWHNDPGKRPTFTELKQDLAALLSDEQTKGAYVDLEALAEEMADQVN